MNDKALKIDRGIPVPTRAAKYPFREMQVGDSFFVPCNENNARAVYCSMTTNSAHHFGKSCVRRVVENGVLGIRVWRRQ